MTPTPIMTVALIEEADIVASQSVQGFADALWDTDEVDRLVALAFEAPSLMDHRDQLIWSYVRKNAYYWRGRYHDSVSGESQEFVWDHRERKNLVIDRLRTFYPTIKTYIEEGTRSGYLPRGIIDRKKRAGNVDDTGEDSMPDRVAGE